MSLPYPDLLQSPTFKFIVGPERSEFVIHKGIVSKHSPVLDTLMNGPMKEAQDGYAVLEYTNSETFGRFAQFAYTGTYQPAAYSHDFNSAKPSSEETMGNAAVRPSKRWAEEGLLWQLWSRYRKPSSVNKVKPNRNTYNFDKAILARPNTGPTEDYSHVFRSHAEVWVFADKYGIQELRNIAYWSLYRALFVFTPYRQRANDIVELLRYVRDNTPEVTRHMQVPQFIRLLVITFVTWHVEVFMESTAFQSLLSEGGSIPVDLMKYFLRDMQVQNGTKIVHSK